MSLIEEVNKYKYVMMPFEAFGFPGPVYNHLVASNDGLNWTDLYKYGFGWRDVDLSYINGKYYISSGRTINTTTNFETFTSVPFNEGLVNNWASEWFQDHDGQWWIIYCGGGKVDYSLFTIYANKFNPTNNTFGSRNEIKFSDNHGRIDPNVNYINGKYYLWVSITNRPQKLQLYVSDSLLGTYDPVATNINQIRQEAGFGWNEAPEMIIDNGTYYLYSDPWNSGENEHDRDLYRTSSTDLINWSPMERCNCDFGMRHATPCLVESCNSSIELWDGDINNFYITNLSNYRFINNFINQLNNSGNDLIEPINWKLDTNSYDMINRNAYNQFINNATILKNNLGKLVENVRMTDYDYQIPLINVPKETNLSEQDINEFWNTINSIMNWITGQLKFA